MSAFTQEQQEILAALGKTTISYIGAVHRVVDMLCIEVAALKLLIGRKGLATLEELEAATKEIEAAHAVEVALSPEIEAAEEQMRRLIAGETPAGPTA